MSKKLMVPDFRRDFVKDIKQSADKLNKYAAGIALIISIFVGVSTSIIKFFTYISIKGRTDYFCWESSIIDVFNQNILFDFIFSSALFTIMIFNTYVFFVVYRGKSISFFKRFFYLVIAFGVVFAINFMLFMASAEVWQLPLTLTIVNLLYALVIYLMQRFPQKAKKSLLSPDDHSSPQEKRTRKKFLYYCMQFILTFGLVATFLYQGGQASAKKDRVFRLIDSTHIVVYENDEYYFANKCTISDNSVVIFTNFQRQYPKTGAETFWQTFSNVTLVPQQEHTIFTYTFFDPSI